MTARQTRAKIKRIAKKYGSYRALADKLSYYFTDNDKTISGSGTYQWYVRGIIPEYWAQYMDELD